MEYRDLGGGIRVSRLALGGGVFGRDCGKKETLAVISAAADLGVNLVDTADVYSGGLSEEWIGEAVRENRSRWMLATKAGVAGGEPRGGKGRKENVLRAAEESLRRLQTDTIDLYQVHHFDPETPLEETLDALDLLVKQGKARLVGASNYSGEQLRSSLRIARERGLIPFSTIQLQYNLFKRDCEKDQLRCCVMEGVRALVYGSLGRGVLTGKYDSEKGAPPNSRAFSSPGIRSDLASPVLQAIAGLTAFAAKKNQTVGKLAIAWTLSRAEIAAVILGVRSPEQLKANVAAADCALSASDLRAIDAAVGDLGQYRNFFSYGV